LNDASVRAWDLILYLFDPYIRLATNVPINRVLIRHYTPSSSASNVTVQCFHAINKVLVLRRSQIVSRAIYFGTCKLGSIFMLTDKASIAAALTAYVVDGPKVQ